MNARDERQRLKAVLLYSRGHLGSAIVFNLIHKRELDIVGVVRASATRSAKTGKLNLKPMRKAGFKLSAMLFWQRLVKLMTYGVAIVASGIRRQGFLPGWLLAHRHKIPVFTCVDVDAPETLEFMRALAPDVIVSAYFHQIIRAPVLALPRLGVLNIHPGWLPNYRGVMNYFWVVHNGEESGGVSVHWIDEGIDTGPLLARARFAITPDMTQHQVLMKTAILGSRLLQQVTRTLLKGETPPPIAVAEEDARYFTMPEPKDFEAYFRKRRFFRIRNILRVLLRGGRRRR